MNTNTLVITGNIDNFNETHTFSHPTKLLEAVQWALSDIADIEGSGDFVESDDKDVTITIEMGSMFDFDGDLYEVWNILQIIELELEEGRYPFSSHYGL